MKIAKNNFRFLIGSNLLMTLVGLSNANEPLFGKREFIWENKEQSDQLSAHILSASDSKKPLSESEKDEFTKKLIKILDKYNPPKFTVFENTSFSTLKDRSQPQTVSRSNIIVQNLGFNYSVRSTNFGLTLSYSDSTSKRREITPEQDPANPIPESNRNIQTRLRRHAFTFIPHIGTVRNFIAISLFGGISSGTSSTTSDRYVRQRVDSSRGSREDIQYIWGLSSGLSVPLTTKLSGGIELRYTDIKGEYYSFIDSRNIDNPAYNNHINNFGLSGSLNYRLTRYFDINAGLGLGYDTKRRQSILPPAFNDNPFILPGLVAESASPKKINKLTTSHTFGFNIGNKKGLKFTVKYNGNRRGNKVRGKTLMFGFKYAI